MPVPGFGEDAAAAFLTCLTFLPEIGRLDRKPARGPRGPDLTAASPASGRTSFSSAAGISIGGGHQRRAQDPCSLCDALCMPALGAGRLNPDLQANDTALHGAPQPIDASLISVIRESGRP